MEDDGRDIPVSERDLSLSLYGWKWSGPSHPHPIASSSIPLDASGIIHASFPLVLHFPHLNKLVPRTIPDRGGLGGIHHRLGQGIAHSRATGIGLDQPVADADVDTRLWASLSRGHFSRSLSQCPPFDGAPAGQRSKGERGAGDAGDAADAGDTTYGGGRCSSHRARWSD